MVRQTVKRFFVAVFSLMLLASPAMAHGWAGDFGLFGDFGGLGGLGLGLGEHHDEFGFFGSFGGGFGLGFFNADAAQTRFENQFNTLQTQYNTGVATGTDFFTSTDYTNIVNKTERLDNRYDLFVSSVQHSIDSLGNIISQTQDDITFYNNLLANYQSDTSISPSRLDRIELVINHITDRLDSRVTSLTDKQNTLETNLPTYQTFQTDISTFLTDIQAAGGTTTGTTGTTTGSTSSLIAALSSPDLTTAVASPKLSLTAIGGQVAACNSMPITTTGAVPEPSAVILLSFAAASTALMRRRRA
jgi:hypothetical protein